MIAELAHTSTIESITNYHYKKIKEGVAEILLTNKIQCNNISETNASFRAYSYLNDFKKPYVHISLNFHPDDRNYLSNDNYNKISKEYLEDLGYSEQPFMVIKHTDQDHPHVHIITTSIEDNGNLIPRFYERYRSQNISRKLEIKHGLTIVPSIKQKEVQTISISNKEDLKNYIKSSIRTVLSFKPKRKDDFFNMLSNQYQIGAYITKSKGVSFHLFDKENGIEIQKFKGYGTKGISGSKLSKDFSLPKLTKQLNYNFETAPKRYRNLKLVENKVNEKLSYFESISIEDFNKIYSIQNLEIFKNNRKIYVIDTKGKNIFSDRDLKNVDFNKLSSVTILNNSYTEELFNEISNEAFYNYKQKSAPYLKESVFIKKIAFRSSFLNEIKHTELFSIYSEYLSSSQEEELIKTAKGYYEHKFSSIDKIAKKEYKEEKKLISCLNNFALNNNIDGNQLMKLFEFIDIKDENTQHSSIKNTFNLINYIEQELSKVKENEKEDFKIYPNIIFQHQQFFSYKQLNEDYKKEYEKIVSEKYIKSVFNTVNKKIITPEDFIREVNKRGVRLSVEQSKSGNEMVIANVFGFDYKTKIKGHKSFLADTVKRSTQKVENNLNNLEFISSLDSGNIAYTNYLVSKNTASVQLIDDYKKTDNYLDYKKAEDIKGFFNSKLRDFKKENIFFYNSDFIRFFIENTEQFKNIIKGNLYENEPIYNELLENFINKNIKEENLSESIRKEEEHFNNLQKILESTKSYSISALCGLRFKGDHVTDLNGKYTSKKVFGITGPGLNAIQEKKYFGFYSKVFYNATKSIFYSQDEFVKTPNGVLVLNKFKKHIPEEYIHKYENYFNTNYIKHYLNKYKSLEKNNRPDFIKYMTGKCINIQTHSGMIELNIKGSVIKVLIDKDDYDLYGIPNVLNDDKQTHFLDKDIYDQIEFNLAVENDNYEYAAYLFINSNVSTEYFDLSRLSELEKAIEELNIREEIQSTYYNLFKESDFDYESDYLKHIQKTEINLYKINFIKKDENDPLYNKLLNEFCDKIYDSEFYNDIVYKEKNSLISKVKLAKLYEDNNAVLLFGAKRVNSNTISDYFGKYEINLATTTSSLLEEIQNQPYFKYYSYVFEVVSKQLFLDEKPFLDPIGVLVYTKFENLIDIKHREEYKNLFTENYINGFVDKLEELGKISEEQKIRFLNNKGIKVEENKHGVLLASLCSFNTEVKIDVSKFFTKDLTTIKQVDYLLSKGLFDENKLLKQAEFTSFVESGNYIGAAWLVYKKEVEPLFIDSELSKHKEELNFALQQIKNKTLASDIIHYTQQLFNDYQNGYLSLSNPIKNKKRKKRRRF